MEKKKNNLVKLSKQYTKTVGNSEKLKQYLEKKQKKGS